MLSVMGCCRRFVLVKEVVLRIRSLMGLCSWFDVIWVLMLLAEIGLCSGFNDGESNVCCC